MPPSAASPNLRPVLGLTSASAARDNPRDDGQAREGGEDLGADVARLLEARRLDAAQLLGPRARLDEVDHAHDQIEDGQQQGQSHVDDQRHQQVDAGADDRLQRAARLTSDMTTDATARMTTCTMLKRILASSDKTVKMTCAAMSYSVVCTIEMMPAISRTASNSGPSMHRREHAAALLVGFGSVKVLLQLARVRCAEDERVVGDGVDRVDDVGHAQLTSPDRLRLERAVLGGLRPVSVRKPATSPSSLRIDVAAVVASKRHAARPLLSSTSAMMPVKWWPAKTCEITSMPNVDARLDHVLRKRVPARHPVEDDLLGVRCTGCATLFHPLLA